MMNISRLLSLHHAEAQGYELLGRLLELRIPLPDIWSSLFLPILCRPSSPSLRFLMRRLRTQPLPASKPRHKLRHQLLDWLIPAHDEFTDTSSSPDFGCESMESAQMKAEILVALSIRDTMTICELPAPKNKPSKMEQMESVYIWMENDIEEKTITIPKKEVAERLEKEVWNKVLDMVKREAEQMLDTEEMDVSI